MYCTVLYIWPAEWIFFIQQHSKSHALLYIPIPEPTVLCHTIHHRSMLSGLIIPTALTSSFSVWLALPWLLSALSMDTAPPLGKPSFSFFAEAVKGLLFSGLPLTPDFAPVVGSTAVPLSSFFF